MYRGGRVSRSTFPISMCESDQKAFNPVVKELSTIGYEYYHTTFNKEYLHVVHIITQYFINKHQLGNESLIYTMYV